MRFVVHTESCSFQQAFPNKFIALNLTKCEKLTAAMSRQIGHLLIVLSMHLFVFVYLCVEKANLAG